MSGIDPKMAEMEAEDLRVHVAAGHERYRHIDASLMRIERLIEKNAQDTKESFAEIKKVIVWAASTLFATMLIAMLSTAFKGAI